MSISRRELLSRAAALGASTVVPLGCTDDGNGDGEAETSETGSTATSAATTDIATGTDTDDGPSTTSDDDGLPTYEFEGDLGPEDLFQHGVASGDPLLDSVIVWTRVTGAPDGAVEAFFEVALDPEFNSRVDAAYVEVPADRDHTLKLDLTGLEPGTTYFYRFYALGRTSLVGRTKTAATGDAQRLRIAVASCSSLAHGYFHSYANIAQRADLDLVLHLGDYIYEYASGGYGALREYEPAYEIVSLDDYRTRYAQYRRDADLQACHRQHAMVAVWDDHELANNTWSEGADNHQPQTEGDFEERKAAAYRAYAEWMPIREGAEGIIYRSLPYGSLLHLIMLDTRVVGRDEQPAFDEIDDPDRQLLGATQEAWLAEELEAPAQWKLIGQQVMVAPLQVASTPLNLDQWDGYREARRRLYDLIRPVSDVVVLTGDIHSSWAFELSDDPFMSTDDTLAVEFVCPSVTSPGFPANSAEDFMERHPHMKWGNLTSRGYMLLDVTPQRLQCSWWLVDNVEDPAASGESVGAVFSVASGTSRLVADDAPAAPVDTPPPLAP